MTHYYYHLNVVYGSRDELWGPAVDPEHTTSEMLMAGMDEINHHLRRFHAWAALQNLRENY